MATSSDSAAFELAWSAKYTSTYPLDHRPLTVCLHLKEGRQQSPSIPDPNRQEQSVNPIQDDRQSRKRKNPSTDSVKSRRRNKPTRIWAPSSARSRGPSTKVDSSTTTTSEEGEWNLKDGNDIIQQSLRAMQQE